MKPTQQEIIELAREAGMDVTADESLWWAVHQDELERLVHLALERFGAGGGELVCHLMECKDVHGEPCFIQIDDPEGVEGTFPVYTHSPPTDLRAEYLRGLEEGFKEGWIECSKWSQRDDLIADIGSPSYEACVATLKALKGKQ